jgi:hypothetical protein
MAATDQILAMGTVWGVLRELHVQSERVKGKDDSFQFDFFNYFLLAQQVFIAFAFADSWRGFMFILCMPIGLYKVARIATRLTSMFWFSQCWAWWQRHSPKWRENVKTVAVVIGLICAAVLVYGVDDGCPEDGCDPIEDWV